MNWLEESIERTGHDIEIMGSIEKLIMEASRKYLNITNLVEKQYFKLLTFLI